MTLRAIAIPALIVLGLLASGTLASANSPEQLADEAVTFYHRAQRSADGNERGRLMFMANQRIRAIRSDYPRHPIAAQIAFGRYNQIDVATLERLAGEWRLANPQAARTIENPASALVPQFGAPPPGAQSEPPAPPTTLIPNFGAPSPSAPSASIPGFGSLAPQSAPSFPGSRLPGVPPAPAFPNANPPGANVAIPLSVQESRPIPRSEVVERLRRAAVIVYYRTGNASGHGTGFFISPNHILTNTHVVEDVDRVVVANKVIGVRLGKVIHRGMNARSEGIDTALIELQGQPASSFLPFASNAQEGETVAVAGYPGTPLERDRGAVAFFSTLKENRIPSNDDIPSVRFDFGTMQGVYIDQTRGIENIQMGINVTNGSSGSPIVNQCGQVIAQHYEGSRADIKRSQSGFSVNPARFSYAISFRELLKFLRAYNVVHTAASALCLD